MEKPSFKSSPWIRGAPHRVFSRDIRRTRWRISLDTGGRPGFPRRDFHVQKSLNPLRCQPTTVSGLTITRAWRQPGHRQDRMTQKTLSAFRSDGRGLFRFRTATCCRRARISVWSAARSAKISMILCMPERVSGGDAKFQGFCDRWNKWEGQRIRRCDEHGQSAIIVVQHGVCGAERLDQNRVWPVSCTWALENPGLAATPDKGQMQSGETRIHRIRLEAFVRLEAFAHRDDPVDRQQAVQRLIVELGADNKRDGIVRTSRDQATQHGREGDFERWGGYAPDGCVGWIAPCPLLQRCRDVVAIEPATPPIREERRPHLNCEVG